MRLRAVLVAAGASLLLVGVAGAAPPRPVVLGISWEGVGKLAWFDARTLAPVGRRVNIGPPPTGVVARSPDGRTIALGSGTAAALRFIDIRAMRATGRVVVPGAGSLLYGIWPRPDRLVALVGGEAPAILAVDPRARRVLDRRPLEGQLSGLARAGPVDRAFRELAVRALPRGRYSPQELVFASVRGTPLHPSNFNRRDWRPALERAGLAEHGYRFHDLRHTCVSRLIAAGADIKLVQAVAGHANPMITLKRYSHLLDSRVTEAADRFDPARTA